MPKKDKPLAASTLKKRRRRKPIFRDEPIQWHLNNSKHDYCPWCGLAEVGYLGKRRRTCMNPACGLDIELPKPSTEFFRDKLEGEDPTEYGDPHFVVDEPEEPRGLLECQKLSRNGRGVLIYKVHGALSHNKLYWHGDGHCPERHDGTPAMAIGSPFWYWLWERQINRNLSHVWRPDEPFTALEVLAKAGTDDPVYFVRSAS